MFARRRSTHRATENWKTETPRFSMNVIRSVKPPKKLVSRNAAKNNSADTVLHFQLRQNKEGYRKMATIYIT